MLGNLLTNRLALQSFPIVIHLVDDIFKQDRLNNAFKAQLAQLPKKNTWLITKGANYKELFHNLTNLIEVEMALRIDTHKVDLSSNRPKIE